MALRIQSRRNFVVQNKLGLHATPAALIVRTINKYPGIDVWVRQGDEQVNGHSIMGLMMLEARYHTHLLFILEGGEFAQQEALLHDLEVLFDQKFNED
ncbi:MAG: HPr family phosphocarrier protein [Verrucomicrobiota bacterium]|nr:MAG: HPr family phosphocarrier protein [Verrucomicrobiota bacterium]